MGFECEFCVRGVTFTYRGAAEEAYPVDSGLSRCSMLSDRIGAVAKAGTNGEGAVARGI